MFFPVHRFFCLALLLTLPNMTLLTLHAAQMQDELPSESAYLASQQAAHWSAYVPIAAVLGATVFFGVADQSHQSSSSSHSGSEKKYSSPSRSTSQYTCRGCYRNQASSHH